MNRSNVDEALAIISKPGTGMRKGQIADLKGKRVAVMHGQTPHEYLTMQFGVPAWPRTK